jgi:hypothetical protein
MRVPEVPILAVFRLQRGIGQRGTHD